MCNGRQFLLHNANRNATLRSERGENNVLVRNLIQVVFAIKKDGDRAGEATGIYVLIYRPDLIDTFTNGAILVSHAGRLAIHPHHIGVSNTGVGCRRLLRIKRPRARFDLLQWLNLERVVLVVVLMNRVLVVVGYALGVIDIAGDLSLGGLPFRLRPVGCIFHGASPPQVGFSE